MAHPVYKVKVDLDKVEKSLRLVLRQIDNGSILRVPSVTTVIGKFKEAGGLIHWAWDLGMQGIDYRQVRDAAAGAGTMAHSMVEADIRGLPQPKMDGNDQDQWSKALSSFGAYKEWRRQTQLVPEHTEVSLTCQCHLIGGTLDTILVQGRRSLGDWKTASAVYSENLLQLSAYKHLWEVNHPDQPIEGGFHLLRFSKAEGDFAHHYWPNLDDAWTAFEHMRVLYDLMARIKERV